MLYNDDCIDVLRKLDSNSVDAVITDPPYGINYKTNHRKDKEHDFCSTIQNDDDLSLMKDVIRELHRVMKDNTAGYMFCSFDRIDFFKQEIERYFRIKNIIIWVKNNWTAGDLVAQFGKQYEMIILFNKGTRKINGKRIPDVWYFDRISGSKQLHQNEKPTKLISQCVMKHSDEGDIVLDPFMGSGTTGVVCKELGRGFIGIEIDENYFNLAKERIHNTMKKKYNIDKWLSC